MPYRVRAVPRDQWPGRNRDGRHFPSAHWTVLEDDEATEAIREDPVLIVERITDAEAAAARAAQLPEPAAPGAAPEGDREEADSASEPASSTAGRADGETTAEAASSGAASGQPETPAPDDAVTPTESTPGPITSAEPASAETAPKGRAVAGNAGVTATATPQDAKDATAAPKGGGKSAAAPEKT